jgi:hypothetical protein
VGKTAGADAFTQVRDCGRVAQKILKTHGLRVAVDGEERDGGRPRPAAEGLSHFQGLGFDLRKLSTTLDRFGDWL